MDLRHTNENRAVAARLLAKTTIDISDNPRTITHKGKLDHDVTAVGLMPGAADQMKGSNTLKHVWLPRGWSRIAPDRAARTRFPQRERHTPKHGVHGRGRGAPGGRCRSGARSRRNGDVVG